MVFGSCNWYDDRVQPITFAVWKIVLILSFYKCNVAAPSNNLNRSPNLFQKSGQQSQFNRDAKYSQNPKNDVLGLYGCMAS